MSVQLSSRNFQNSVMGLNSSSKKFPGNVLFRNTEGGADLSKQVEKRLNSSEFYKRNSKVLIPSKDGKSMEVYTVFEDDGSGTVVLTREGAPKKKGEGPEIFMKKVQKSTLLETNPLPVAEKRVEKARSTPSASPEQVAQVEAAAVDRQVERALNTVIDGVNTERGIEEARLALETAGNSSAFSTNTENQFFQTLSPGDKVPFTDVAASSDRQEPFVSLGQKRETKDSRRERHNNATTAEDIDVSLAEAERARHDEATKLLNPDEMEELYDKGKNNRDEELDLDEDEPHMVLDALLQKFEESPTFDSKQAESFNKVILRLPKNEQGSMFQEIINRIKAKREKQDSEHRSKIEAALKNSPAGGRFEEIKISPEEFAGKLQNVLRENPSAEKFKSLNTKTDAELNAEDDERIRSHNAGESYDETTAIVNKRLRNRKIAELNTKMETLLKQKQEYIRDGAQEESPVLRLVERERSTLIKNLEKLRQEQEAEDLRGEVYKKEGDIDMSAFDEYVAPAPHVEIAPPSEPTLAETPKPSAKKKGFFGKIASAFAAVGLAFGLASGGGTKTEQPKPDFEPEGPASASDSSMSSVETASPLVSSNVSVEAPRARTNVSSPEASSSAPLMSESVPEVSSYRVEAPVKASAPKVEARSSSRLNKAPESSNVEIPLASKIESITTSSVRFNPAEDPTFQKLDKYNNTYFNVAENSLYKELGDKVMQIKFGEHGELRGGYIALKNSNEIGQYNVKTKINFKDGVMYIGDNDTKAPAALQDWAKKLQGQYDSYGTM